MQLHSQGIGTDSICQPLPSRFQHFFLPSGRGYQVTVATSTGQALKIAKSRPIDILIADVRLREGLAGIELAHELAKTH